MIRAAKQNDATDVARLCLQLGYNTSKEDCSSRQEMLSRDENSAVFVADVDGRVVGWIQLSVRLSIESGEFVEIVGLVVDEGYRGRGVGRALVSQGEDWARARGQRTFRVRTNVVREDAPLFYRSMGFKETKRQSVFVKTLSADSIRIA